MLVSALTEVQTFNRTRQPGPALVVLESGERVPVKAPASSKETFFAGYEEHSLSDVLTFYGDTHSVVRFRQYGLTFYALLRGDMVKNTEYLRIYLDCGYNMAQAKEVRILSGGKWRPVPSAFWQGR